VEILRAFTPGAVASQSKVNGDPVTEADRLVNEALRGMLPAAGEGWLSEETADDLDRLRRRRVWVVDPLDGTREFIEGVPEWCVSIGLVEKGLAVAGGICNPITNQVILGSIETGVSLNGQPVHASERQDLPGATVLASRSEVKRGEWDRFRGASFTVRPCGSVAYKLGLVAAGLADATWTLTPKNEWDVAAGAALVRSSGGDVRTSQGQTPAFNQRSPRLTGLIATGRGLAGPVAELLGVAP